MQTIDKILNGILVGSMVAIGSITAYYKIKRDTVKETLSAQQTYSTGPWTETVYTLGGRKKHDKKGKNNKGTVRT